MVKTALVVEDDSGIASLLKDALEAAGLQVLVEKDGELGWQALQKRLPDVVVTDLLLPLLPGLELLGRLRALPGGDVVPVIVISGIYKSARHKRNAREQFGVIASFDKPFETDAVVAAVVDAVGLGVKKPASPPAREVAMRNAVVSAVDIDKAVRGNLKQRRFPELLAQVFRFKATGALLLRRGRIKKIVYVKDGLPVFVKSNMLSECLGRVLVREKMITEVECERSVEQLPRSRGKLQGQVLIEMGALSTQNLAFGLQLQLEQKLYDVFSWADGDYQFNSRVDFPSEGITLDVSLANLILEGVRRRYSDAFVGELLDRSNDLYLGLHSEPNHGLGDFVLDPDERILLALVDGRRTTREVIDAAGIAPRVARQLVYAMMAAELAQTSRRPAAFARPESRPPPRPSSPSVLAPAPPPLPPRRKEPPASPPRAVAPAAAVAAVVAREGVGGEGVDALRTLLTTRVRQLKRANHFEVLGVSRRAGLEEVRRAASSATKALQPDGLHRSLGAPVPADLRALAAQLLPQIAVAVEVLGDERRRADYEHRLDRPHRSTSTTELHRLLEADTLARAGDVALDAGRNDDAVAAYEAATVLLPDEGELAASLAWSLFQRAQNDPAVQADALVRLHRAVTLAPRFDRGWFWLGRVLQRTGRTPEARLQFERALGCNPDHRESRQELAR